MLDILMHRGTPQPYNYSPTGSGRYRQGSGADPYQHSLSVLQRIKELEKDGLTAEEIRKTVGYSSGDIRKMKSIVKNQQIRDNVARVHAMNTKGMSPKAISEKTGLPLSTVRNYIKEGDKKKAFESAELADVLKDQVKKKKYLDIGAGVELQLGVSSTRLNTVAKELEASGEYKVQKLRVNQATNPNQQTIVKVLTKADVPWSEIKQNQDKIQSVLDVYKEDGVIKNIKPPVSISSSRIKVVYAEDGGVERDGLMLIRPGVKDISLGENRYAQVRIAVDGTSFLKGMAMYGDGRQFKNGADILFYTNKKRGTPMINADDPDHQVLKALKIDKETGKVDLDNPFGAIVRQREYDGDDGKKYQSAINIVNEDEDWKKWSKTLSSQFLSKQYVPLAKKQLDLTYDKKAREYEVIQSVTNPVVKEKLLTTFADNCDSAAVHLKAAALPRQSAHVLLPFPEIKETEIYAPNYKQGEKVALVRYPHAGVFEIPVLTVNNNIPGPKKALGATEFAVGINHKTAEQLSGADFDGDTAVIIPLAGQKLRTAPAIPGLSTFDTKAAFPAYEGMPRVGPETGFVKGREMGKVSNLITDMNLKGCDKEDLIRAVKHSMVVIDAEKHNLDWRASEKYFGIKELKKKYQGLASNGQLKGASTIISKAKSTEYVLERDRYTIDPVTGEKVWHYTNKTHYDKKKGKEVPNTMASTKMAEAKDAFTLTSDGKGTIAMERVYAEYANRMKAMANQARKDILAIKPTPYDPNAKKVYAAEVESLNDKLKTALLHAPIERKAQLVADKQIRAKLYANPDMTKDEKKKLRSIAIAEARAHMGDGTGKDRIKEITDREWEAIQAGAFTKTHLKSIIDNADLDKVKEKAIPRTVYKMTPARVSRAKQLLAQGYTKAEVAEQLGVTRETLNNSL